MDGNDEIPPNFHETPKRCKRGDNDPGHELMQATSALRSISQRNNQPFSPPPPPSPRVKSIDEHFGETVGKLMGEIPDGVSKDMLKLNIQRQIY